MRNAAPCIPGRGALEALFPSSRVSTARMVVVPGWFNETLPPAGLRRIAFLRLDGDLYESTRDAITALYPLVASGGDSAGVGGRGVGIGGGHRQAQAGVLVATLLGRPLHVAESAD